MVRYKVLKVTKLQCFKFSYNEAYSLLTFGIQLLNSSIHDFHNGGRRADLETILHANEATKASRKT